MPTKDIEPGADLGLEGPSRSTAKTALAMATIGWLIIGFSLNSIIFNAFPLKLALPEWQLSIIAALLSSSMFLLIGATLIALAPIFSPHEKILQDWNVTVCRAASWLALLLVLITPLQFFVGARALKNQSKATNQAINRLKSIAKGLSGLNSENELRAFVLSLPNAPRLPAKFDAAFPVVKQRSIANIQAQINAATENIDLQKSEGTQIFLREAIRNTAQAILMAAAFSTLAALSSRSTNAVTRFFEKRGPMGSARWPR
jgi:hypothetical protein